MFLNQELETRNTVFSLVSMASQHAENNGFEELSQLFSFLCNHSLRSSRCFPLQILPQIQLSTGLHFLPFSFYLVKNRVKLVHLLYVGLDGTTVNCIFGCVCRNFLLLNNWLCTMELMIHYQFSQEFLGISSPSIFECVCECP